MVKLELNEKQREITIDNKIPKKMKDNNNTEKSFKLVICKFKKADKNEFDRQFPDGLAYGIRC